MECFHRRLGEEMVHGALLIVQGAAMRSLAAWTGGQRQTMDGSADAAWVEKVTAAARPIC